MGGGEVTSRTAALLHSTSIDRQGRGGGGGGGGGGGCCSPSPSINFWETECYNNYCAMPIGG